MGVMPRKQKRFLQRLVEEFQAAGRLTFSVGDLCQRGIERNGALLAAIRRYAATGAIRRISPRSDFFIIVPPEFRAMGAPPVEWWLGDYMAHLKTPYYVGLLSAAALHGSAHFAVMETQVVVPGAMRPLSVGRVRVRFFVKAAVTAAPVETRSNLWGAVEVSTPEATLLDLLRYNRSIERTALIVGDLAKKCRPADLRKALDAANDPPSAQRLGYLFETSGHDDLAKTIEKWLSSR